MPKGRVWKKNTNFYRMWGKGERDVSYTSTKAITHRNALVNLKKKKKTYFILDTESARRRGNKI